MAEFFHEQGLVGVIASQAIGTEHIEPLELLLGGGIAQALEGWAGQIGTTVTFIDEGERLLRGQSHRPVAARAGRRAGWRWYGLRPVAQRRRGRKAPLASSPYNIPPFCWS